MNSINDNNISLIEETHEYVLKTKPDLKFKSVTTLLDQLFEPFDEVKIATKTYAWVHERMLEFVHADPEQHQTSFLSSIKLYLKKK